jgi:hypothetical protein
VLVRWKRRQAKDIVRDIDTTNSSTLPLETSASQHFVISAQRAEKDKAILGSDDNLLFSVLVCCGSNVALASVQTASREDRHWATTFNNSYLSILFYCSRSDPFLAHARKEHRMIHCPT